MISFPSTLNRGGSNLQTTNVPSSIKDTIKNSWKQAVTSGIGAMTSGNQLDTEGIRYDESQNKKELLNKLNYTNNGVQYSHKPLINSIYEDPFHLPATAIDVVNKYKAVIYNGPVETLNTAIMQDGQQEPKYVRTHAMLAGSLFNPYYGVLSKGISANTPLMNNQYKFGTDVGDVSDCSIKNLIYLSNQKWSILGQARYKYADFMYCKDLGKISNNHLITLRKFTTPVGDNIFVEAALPGDRSNWAMQGDVGRLVTWFGTEDNKLEDILKYNFSASWEEMKAEWDQKYTQEQTGSGSGLKGALSTAVQMMNPSTWNNVTIGTNPAINLPFGLMPIEAGPYEHDDVVLGKNYDTHKIYEPKDIIDKTHIYAGKLSFNHEFTLTFSYKMRGYDNINPKAAFLDLLANVTTVTYRRGEFWGGRNQILGVQPYSTGWNFANDIIHKTFDKGRDLTRQVIDNGAALGKETFTQENAEKAIDTVKNGAKAAWQAIQNFDYKAFASNALNTVFEIGKGLALNYLGRPAVYQFNSLLEGDNTGLWHVTIGNPLNPIASFGNLIIKDTSIQHLGPLGIDDFPTELKVTVTLQHARSRDAFEIQRMYTKGTNSIYTGLNSITDFEQVYSLNGTGFEAAWDNVQVPARDASGNLVKENGKDVTTSKYLKTPRPQQGESFETNDIREHMNYLGDWDMRRIQTNRLQLS